jgi:tetratricopeptide (TPR) repeat protein
VFVATFAAILIVTALLLSLDLFLARLDRRASDAHAADEYAEGRTLLAAGRADEASARFGAAVAIDRQNENYALALGEAMLAEGRIASAETTLKALLDRAENDGQVNLTMAHVMLREGRTAEAKSYFHRAICLPNCCPWRRRHPTARCCSVDWVNCSSKPVHRRGRRQYFASCCVVTRTTQTPAPGWGKQLSALAIFARRMSTWLRHRV